jgi:predicted nucleic acid-binding protein
MSAVCVVHASVGVKLFVAEPLSDQAASLFERLAAPEPAVIHVPDAFYYEVAAALRKYAVSAGYPNLQRDVARLEDLYLNITPTVVLLMSAAQISTNYGLSIYDALYLALALEVGAPLITADDRLLRSVQGKPFDVRSLAAVNPLEL